MFLLAHRFSRATNIRFLLPPPLQLRLPPASVRPVCHGPRGPQTVHSLCAQAACGCSSAAVAAMKASVISSSYTTSAASSTCEARCHQLSRSPVLAARLDLLQIPMLSLAKRHICICSVHMMLRAACSQRSAMHTCACSRSHRSAGRQPFAAAHCCSTRVRFLLTALR